ncbi:MAG TPA: pitrilysin family protein [Gemmatimonadales bacterium]|nr:pitrilysin family protein [Gemmatimonadales bacterium]
MSDRLVDGVHREVLPNGLTALIQPDQASEAVAIVTHVRAGFFDEPDHLAGVSHVLEHMFFKGTPLYGPGELARRTKAAGGWLNAGTGYDHTSYYTVLPAGALATGLELQADALRHATLDAEELRRELQVIIEEAKRKRDSPSAVAHETMHAVLFDRHRIRRWRIGDEARLAEFTREDVAGYYRSRYVPSRTIVAIVGGVTVESAMALVRARFESWEAHTEPIPPGPEEPWHHEVRVRTLRGDVTQANLVLGWRTVPPLQKDAPALDVAAAVLSAGRSAWLPQALRETGIVLSVSANHFSPTEVGVFSITADMDPARLPEALGVVGHALDRLATQGPSPDDLARARTLMRAHLARRLESAEARASLFAEVEAQRDLAWIEEWAERIQTITGAEVRNAAGRWLRGDAVAAVAYLPETSGEDLTVDTVRDAFQVRRKSRPVRRIVGTRVVALDGLDVLVRARTGSPLVSLGIYRRRRHAEDATRAGVGMLGIRSAIRGAGGLDALALAQAFDRLGGPVTASISADHFGFGATVLVEHLLPAADLLRRVMWQPHFAKERVAVERETLVREAAQVADDMFRYPFQLALGAAFRDEGYGLPTGGTVESVGSLGADLVREWHSRELAGGRSVVVAIGDFDPDAAASALADALVDVPGSSDLTLPARSPVAPRPGDALRLVQRNRAQSAIAMAFPGPARTSGDRFAAEVWATAAGGLGGRLFDALRDRRSLAYTVMASAWQRMGAGALLTYIATSPEREDEAREQMLVELDRFRREGITPDELQRATGYLVGHAAVSRQTGGAVAGELVDLWLANESLENFEQPGQPYQAVTLAAVQAVLAASLDPGKRAEGVVRGR